MRWSDEDSAPEPEPTPQSAVISIGYEGGGSAFVVQQPDGSHTIQLNEDFSGENAPALVIYLSTTTDLSDAGVLSSADINPGPLQAIESYQEYVVPVDSNSADWSSMIVWYEEFDVAFVGALLTS